MEHTSNKLHPLVATAAVSLIVLSAAGVGALTGLLPKSGASLTERSVNAPAASATTAAPGGITLPIPAATPAPAPKPAVKKVARPAVQARAPEPARDFTPAEFKQAPPVARAKCLDCGEVAAVNEVEQKGEGSWIGPVAGGVGGAILGKQMGKGSGNTIMTILGAAGGAYAGHKIEQHARATKRWDVVVRLEDGSTRTVSYNAQPAWRIGDRIRLNNGALEAEQRT